MRIVCSTVSLDVDTSITLPASHKGDLPTQNEQHIETYRNTHKTMVKPETDIIIIVRTRNIHNGEKQTEKDVSVKSMAAQDPMLYKR